jgi:copper(I)-binding protein
LDRPGLIAEGEAVLKQLPSHRGPIGRAGAMVLGTALSALLVAGCAAGQDAQTVNQRPPIDGASASAGNIAVRGAGLSAPTDGTSYAKGSSAQLELVLVNTGTSDDTLVSVTSPAAGGAQFSASGTPDLTSSTISASPSDSSSSSASGSPSTSGSPTTSGSSDTASATASDSSSAATSSPIDLPAGNSVLIGYGDGPSVTLTGLTQQLFPAQAVPVTLTFGSGATVTLTLTVKLASSPPSAPVVSDATEPTD